MRAAAGSIRRRRRGLSLALVTLHAVLLLAAWSLANRQTVGLVRLKTYAAHRETSRGHRERAARRLATGYALALLETGVPPRSPYEAAVEIDSGPAADDTMRFVLRFEEVSPPEPPAPETVADPPQWTVRIRRDDDGALGLPRPWRFDPPAARDGPESG